MTKINHAVSDDVVRKAANAFAAKCGITIYLPDEGTLDDFEQERYEALRDAILAALQAHGEDLKAYTVAGWIYEDELPSTYPYDAMFPYSKVDGVRVFPVFHPISPDPPRCGEAAHDLIADWLSEGIDDLPDDTGVTINIGKRCIIKDTLGDLRAALSGKEGQS